MQNHSASPSDGLLLSAREAAKALKVSERTLFSLTRDKTIPAVRLNRRVLYDPADLRRAIDAAKTGGSDDRQP